VATAFGATAALSLAGGDLGSIYAWYGAESGDYFGWSVAGVSDLDGDGIADMIVGAPRTGLGAAPGYARVYAGGTGALLFTLTGQFGSDDFGCSVADAGDVDGDSVNDVIVGAREWNLGGPGYARVFSGSDQTVIHTIEGDSGGDLFGDSVASVMDTNGDSVSELLVGSPQDTNNATYSGRIDVLDGVSGALRYAVVGDGAYDELGRAVAGVGDMDGDGFGDFVGGAFQLNGAGYARLYSGFDGGVLESWSGNSVDDYFGGAVGGLADVDEDGVAETIVGAYAYGNGPGYCRVFSGATGALLLEVVGDEDYDQLGYSVDGMGDVDGDGIADLIAGAPVSGSESPRCYARVFSGADGSILCTVLGTSNADWFGEAVSGVGDLNGDGRAEVLVGGTRDNTAATWAGAARVFDVAHGGGFVNYGTGLGGVGGQVPAVKGTGCPSPNMLAAIRVTNGLGGANGILLVGPFPVSAPALGGTLLVAPLVAFPLPLSGMVGIPGFGYGSLVFSLPNNAALIGLSLFFQGLHLDPGAPYGVSMTDGIEMRVG
jgi:hypothetical protein